MIINNKLGIFLSTLLLVLFVSCEDDDATNTDTTPTAPCYTNGVCVW